MAIHISIPHKKTTGEAVKNIKSVIAELIADYGDEITDLTENWKGNSCEFNFNVRNYSIKGILVVMATSYELTGDVPWSLSLFKSKIEKLIKDRALELLKKYK
jgi:hypothetical protein